MKQFCVKRSAATASLKNLRTPFSGDNSLAANFYRFINRVLNPVVEVQYTTGSLSLARV